MSVLMIVESPNKAKKIRGYFKDFTVLATVGHFQDLPQKEMGVEPPEHKPQYVVMPGKADIVKRVRHAAKSASTIYIATDPDREGEAIGAHLVNLLGNRYKNKIHRITYNEISKQAINDAINKKRDIDWNLVRAQEGRRVLDRYVGYMVSSALTHSMKPYGLDEFLSSGRVQTLVLRLLVERQKAIDTFVAQEHYGVTAMIQHQGLFFKAHWLTGLTKGELMMDLAKAESVVRNTVSLTVADINTTFKSVAPPKPLTTSTFCQLMATQLKLTTKQSMSAAQKLFESGLITYHRTDSVTVSEDFVKHVWVFAADNKLPLPPAPRVYEDGKNAQQGHECLRVSDINLKSARAAGVDDPTLQNVYRWIWRISLESQLGDGQDSIVSVSFRNDKMDTFITRASTVSNPGWRNVADRFQHMNVNAPSGDENTEDSMDLSVTLPRFLIDDVLLNVEPMLEVKHTQPPAVFSEKTLTVKMDKLAIGRPSTYAQTFERLVDMRYVTRTELKLTPTTKGIAVVQALLPFFSFMQYDYTALVEECLDAIASGKSQYLRVVSRAFNALSSEIETFHKSPLPEPAIASLKNWKPHTGTTTIPPKKTTENKSKPNIPIHPRSQAGQNCPACASGKLKLKTFTKGNSAGKEFMGCSNFPTCQYFAWTQPLEEQS